MSPIRTLSLPLVLALALLAGCGRQSEEEALAELDNRIAANSVDPAVAAAIEGPIATDPALSQQSNNLAVRATPSPTQAQVPNLGGKAPDRDPAATAGCGVPLEFGAAWAGRLPAPFALYPGGKLSEAAGKDRGPCHVRIVTFTSEAAPSVILNWYGARATGGGYSAQRGLRDGDSVLSGEQGERVYIVIASPIDGGSDVSLIVGDRL